MDTKPVAAELLVTFADGTRYQMRFQDTDEHPLHGSFGLSRPTVRALESSDGWERHEPGPHTFGEVRLNGLVVSSGQTVGVDDDSR